MNANLSLYMSGINLASRLGLEMMQGGRDAIKLRHSKVACVDRMQTLWSKGTLCMLWWPNSRLDCTLTGLFWLWLVLDICSSQCLECRIPSPKSLRQADIGLKQQQQQINLLRPSCLSRQGSILPKPSEDWWGKASQKCCKTWWRSLRMGPATVGICYQPLTYSGIWPRSSAGLIIAPPQMISRWGGRWDSHLGVVETLPSKLHLQISSLILEELDLGLQSTCVWKQNPSARHSLLLRLFFINDFFLIFKFCTEHCTGWGCSPSLTYLGVSPVDLVSSVPSSTLPTFSRICRMAKMNQFRPIH